jgi:predicted Zn-dependent protease with MMP-like domain
LETEKFEELVTKALTELPEEFRNMLDNVDVTVQDYPTRAQLGRMRPGMTLLGLYEGVPHTRRTMGYSMVPPDKITIFQKPIEAIYRSEKEIAAAVQRVVRHEIAHHFGFDEQSLRRIESRDRRREDR